MLWGRLHHGCRRTSLSGHGKVGGAPGILAHMTFTLCLIEDCPYEGVTRGLCRNHYQTARKAGTLDKVALPKKRPAAEEHGALIRELWQDGLLMSEIAEHVGISQPTVKAVLGKLGIENPARHSARARLLKRSREQADWMGQLDHLEPLEAVVQAWTGPGQDPEVVQAAEEEVGKIMPHLARFLDRLADQ